MKKLTKQDLADLMNYHIHELTEEELMAIAFLVDVEIWKYKNKPNSVTFRMTHNKLTVQVTCQRNSNCLIGQWSKGKKRLTREMSWGGCFSIADILSVFKSFYAFRIELVYENPAKKAIYGDECMGMVISAFSYADEDGKRKFKFRNTPTPIV